MSITHNENLETLVLSILFKDGSQYQIIEDAIRQMTMEDFLKKQIPGHRKHGPGLLFSCGETQRRKSIGRSAGRIR